MVEVALVLIHESTSRAICSLLTFPLMVACPTKKSVIPIRSESNPISPIHSTHCVLDSRLVQGAVKVT